MTNDFILLMYSKNVNYKIITFNKNKYYLTKLYTAKKLLYN